MAKPKIVIADDEKPTRDAMARILSPSYECIAVPDAAAAMAALDAAPDAALLVTDYKMPGEDGVSLIRRAKARHPSLACILLTAFGEIDLAVEAMKEGADDFLEKPVTDLRRLEARIAKAIEKNALSRKVEALERQVASSREGLEAFTGHSPAMEKVYRLVRQAAKSSATVLVEGPSGTGKELVARALHDLSPRSAGPFVAVECAALSPTLIESELFGHEKGAFTGADRTKTGKFEAASGGTLFLDEITEIDLSTQVKLLRVLETRRIQRVGGNDDIPVDFRLVAATNRDLAAYVAAGKFREDLYYRLNVVDIHLPPLKDRPGDVRLLVSRFLKEFAKENGGAVTGIDAEAMAALERCPWPGNVRQLRNTVEKMVVLSAGGRLGLADVPEDILDSQTPPVAQAIPAASRQQAEGDAGGGSQTQANAASESARPRPQSLADAKKEAMLAAIERNRYNKTKAAEELGISRRTLHRKLKEWGLG